MKTKIGASLLNIMILSSEEKKKKKKKKKKKNRTLHLHNFQIAHTSGSAEFPRLTSQS